MHRKALNEQLRKLDPIVDTAVAQIEADQQQPAADWKMPEALADREERKKRIREQLAQLDAAQTHTCIPASRMRV